MAVLSHAHSLQHCERRSPVCLSVRTLWEWRWHSIGDGGPGGPMWGSTCVQTVNGRPVLRTQKQDLKGRLDIMRRLKKAVDWLLAPLLRSMLTCREREGEKERGAEWIRERNSESQRESNREQWRCLKRYLKNLFLWWLNRWLSISCADKAAEGFATAARRLLWNGNVCLAVCVIQVSKLLQDCCSCGSCQSFSSSCRRRLDYISASSSRFTFESEAHVCRGFMQLHTTSYLLLCFLSKLFVSQELFNV